MSKAGRPVMKFPDYSRISVILFSYLIFPDRQKISFLVKMINSLTGKKCYLFPGFPVLVGTLLGPHPRALDSLKPSPWTTPKDLKQWLRTTLDHGLGQHLRDLDSCSYIRCPWSVHGPRTSHLLKLSLSDITKLCGGNSNYTETDTNTDTTGFCTHFNFYLRWCPAL